MEIQQVEKVEKWIFYFMSGFALSSCISIAVGNVFLSLSLIAFIIRLYYKHDDVWKCLNVDIRLTQWLIFLMAAVFLSAIFSGDMVAGVSLFIDYYGYRMLGFYIVLIILRDKRKLRIILLLTGISFTLNNYSIFVAALGGEYRPGGLVSGTMTAAGILSMGISVLIFYLFYTVKSKHRHVYKAYLVLMIFLAFAALAYNETRGAWIAVVVTSLLACIFAIRSYKRAFFIGTISFLFLAGVLSVSPEMLHRSASISNVSTDQSNVERLCIWKSSFHMFEEHPILGVGFSQYERAYHEIYIMPEARMKYLGHAHSNVMQYLGESGALGCIALLGVWIQLLYYGYTGWSRTQNPAYAIIFLIVLGLVLQGLTEYNMGNSVVVKLYWFALAICLQWIRLSKEEMKS